MKKILIIVICCTGGLFLLGWGVQAWLGGRIERAIKEKAGGIVQGYTVGAGRVGVNLIGRSINVRGLELIPDSPAGGNKIEISGVRISMKGVGLRKIRRMVDGDGPIILDRIVLSSPAVAVTSHKKVRGEGEGRKKTGGRVVSIGEIIVLEGSFTWLTHQKDGHQEYAADGVDIRAEGFTTDTTAQGKTLFCDQISMKVGEVRHTNRGASVISVLSQVAADTQEGTLSASSFEVKPQYPMEEFAYRDPRHADWTQAGVKDIKCTGLNLSSLTDKKTIAVEAITVASAEISSYKNRKIERTEWIKPLTYQTIQRLPVKVSVGTIEVAHADATYLELPKTGDKAGEVRITGISAKWTGLSNIAETTHPGYTMEATGFFMGKAKFDVKFLLPANPYIDRVEAEGSVGPMDMTIVNPITLPLASASVTSGEVDSIYFRLAGDSHASEASMKLLYHGLKVELEREKKGRMHDREALSWIVNEFVIRDGNPDHRGERTGRGTWERDPYRSQFNYLWKTLLSAIKPSIGLGR